jgi:hypothetical protein
VVDGRAAELTVKPSLTIMEESNDNVHEDRYNKQSDWITHIMPSLGIQYRAPLWDWNLSYNPEYRIYANGTNSNQFIQNVSLNGLIRPIDNFLYISVSESYSQVPYDGNRNSPYNNQSDQNIFSISPYIQYQLNQRWSASGGYRYVNRYYSNDNYGGPYYGNQNSGNNQEHALFLRLTRELTTKSNVFMNVDYARVFPEHDPYHDRLTHTVGGMYQYAEGSSVNAQAGYSLYLPQQGSSELSPTWSLGLIHAWDTYVLTVNSGVSYDSDPSYAASERRFVNARLAKSFHRGTVGIFGGYNQTINNQDSNRIYNTPSSSWFNAGIDGSYELTSRLTARGSISTDKYLEGGYYGGNEGYGAGQFRNSFTVGLRYEVFYDLWVGFDYNRVAYSDSVFSPSGPIEVNRYMFYITKDFQGFRYQTR